MATYYSLLVFTLYSAVCCGGAEKETENEEVNLQKSIQPPNFTYVNEYSVQSCYGSSCYTYYKVPKTWPESRAKCKRIGGDLVSIETELEWSLINDTIQGLGNQLDEWHIGLFKKESTWKWVSGAALSINHWQDNEPNGEGPYSVIAKHYPKGSYGTFIDLSCRHKRGYICETSYVQGESGIDCYNTSCYTFNNQGKSWLHSRRECKKNNGDLVSIETEGEWSFINNKIQQLGNRFYSEWYVGLKKRFDRKKKKKIWHWVNHAPLSINHWQVRIDAPSGDGSCAVIAKEYPEGNYEGFNDVGADKPRDYICETNRAQDCYGSSCYLYSSDAKSWPESRAVCKKNGGDLLSMETEEEWTYFKKKIQRIPSSQTDEWHIGLFKNGSKWKWVSGVALSINHWQDNEPSGEGPYTVLAKYSSKRNHVKFNALSCRMKKGFICETNHLKSGSQKECYTNSCYSFNNDGKTLLESRKECKKNKGDLISIETEEEWSFINNKIKRLSNQFFNQWYVGLKLKFNRKNRTQTWEWLNNAPLTINHWNIKGGEQSVGNGPCVVIVKESLKENQEGFVNMSGDESRKYVCETNRA